MSYLALIPARAGSRGIPGKNLRPIGGRPLLTWTVEQALSAAVDLRVVVSTEDDGIAEVALRAGAEVPFRRPGSLATDETLTEPVVLHALRELLLQGYRPDAVVLLQPTSPVRRPDTVERAVRQFEATQADAVVGVVATSPFLWSLGDPPKAHYDINNRLRRQEFATADLWYRETGSIYVTRTSVYEEQANRLGGRVSLFVMDELEGIDVDEEADLVLAEHALNLLENDSR